MGSAPLCPFSSPFELSEPRSLGEQLLFKLLFHSPFSKCVLTLNNNDPTLGNRCWGVAWLEPGGQSILLLCRFNSTLAAVSSLALGCETQLWPAESCNLWRCSRDEGSWVLPQVPLVRQWNVLYLHPEQSSCVIQSGTEDADSAVSPAPSGCLQTCKEEELGWPWDTDPLSQHQLLMVSALLSRLKQPSLNYFSYNWMYELNI